VSHNSAGSSYFNIETPAIGFPALPGTVAGPCTNYVHRNDTINVVDTSTSVTQLATSHNNYGVNFRHGVIFPLNDSTSLDQNGPMGQKSFMPMESNNPSSLNDVAFPHINNLMGQQEQFMEPSPSMTQSATSSNFGLAPPIHVGIPFNDNFLPGRNGVGSEEFFMPSGNYNLSPFNNGAFSHINNNMEQQGLFMEQSPFPVTSGSSPNGHAPAIAIPVVAGSAIPTSAPTAAIQPAPRQRVPCTICPTTFARASDLHRHMSSMHNMGPQVLHLCSVPGCPKSVAPGYSRRDKVVEHLRKVHGL
jgi:hypothetical protein